MSYCTVVAWFETQSVSLSVHPSAEESSLERPAVVEVMQSVVALQTIAGTESAHLVRFTAPSPNVD